MIALIRDIVGFAINPIHLLVIILVIAVGAKYFGREKIWRWTLGLGLAFFLLTASSPLANVMVGQLEKQYQTAEPQTWVHVDSPINILVLGAGHTIDPDLPAINQVSPSALARLGEGIRLHRMIPGSRLVTSGNGGQSDIPQADVMAKTAITLGVAQDDISRMVNPQNTFQEAVEYKQNFGSESPFILVTSATHMPRAMLTFMNLDLEPIAAPTEFLLKVDPSMGHPWFNFSTDNFSKIQRCLHEYIGILWEKWINHPNQLDTVS